mgnify:CR=1 FL=1
MQYNGIEFDTYFKHYPDAKGFVVKYGGCYISEDLKKAMAEITEAYFTICKSSKFINELRRIRKESRRRQIFVHERIRVDHLLGRRSRGGRRCDGRDSGAKGLESKE